MSRPQYQLNRPPEKAGPRPGTRVAAPTRAKTPTPPKVEPILGPGGRPTGQAIYRGAPGEVGEPLGVQEMEVTGYDPRIEKYGVYGYRQKEAGFFDLLVERLNAIVARTGPIPGFDAAKALLYGHPPPPGSAFSAPPTPSPLTAPPAPTPPPAPGVGTLGGETGPSLLERAHRYGLQWADRLPYQAARAVTNLWTGGESPLYKHDLGPVPSERQPLPVGGMVGMLGGVRIDSPKTPEGYPGRYSYVSDPISVMDLADMPPLRKADDLLQIFSPLRKAVEQARPRGAQFAPSMSDTAPAFIWQNTILKSKLEQVLPSGHVRRYSPKEGELRLSGLLGQFEADSQRRWSRQQVLDWIDRHGVHLQLREQTGGGPAPALQWETGANGILTSSDRHVIPANMERSEALAISRGQTPAPGPPQGSFQIRPNADGTATMIRSLYWGDRPQQYKDLQAAQAAAQKQYRRVREDVAWWWGTELGNPEWFAGTPNAGRLVMEGPEGEYGRNVWQYGDTIYLLPRYKLQPTDPLPPWFQVEEAADGTGYNIIDASAMYRRGETGRTATRRIIASGNTKEEAEALARDMLNDVTFEFPLHMQTPPVFLPVGPHRQRQHILDAVGHNRYSTRQLTNGDWVFFLEEDQSDLFQKAHQRRKGEIERLVSRGVDPDTAARQVPVDFGFLFTPRRAVTKDDLIAQGYEVRQKANGKWEVLNPHGYPSDTLEPPEARPLPGAFDRYPAEFATEEEALTTGIEIANRHLIPPVPWKDTKESIRFRVRRMLQMATQHGHNALAYTTPEEQIRRWGSELAIFKKNADGSFQFVFKPHVDGESVNAGAWEPGSQATLSEIHPGMSHRVTSLADVERIVKRAIDTHPVSDWKGRREMIVPDQARDIWALMQTSPVDQVGVKQPRADGMRNYYGRLFPSVLKEEADSVFGKGKWTLERKEVPIEILQKYSGRDYDRASLQRMLEPGGGLGPEQVSQELRDDLQGVLRLMTSLDRPTTFADAMATEASDDLARALGGEIRLKDAGTLQSKPVTVLAWKPEVAANAAEPFPLAQIAIGALTLGSAFGAAGRMGPGTEDRREKKRPPLGAGQQQGLFRNDRSVFRPAAPPSAPPPFRPY